ncbi:hypothetical protein MOB87_16210 [Bacillus sonorensis]|uniref:hypothetical protein n=1 Tax=Bacillus sonorensis TaxID=119858 RepID=UPI002282DE07|nr:hypothetical protein [Bacillus sonorensis]MCY8089175.1 hypothetical protein [Bacillus sonorensis]
MKTKNYFLPFKQQQLPLLVIILLFPLSITVFEFNRLINGTGINALVFHGYFSNIHPSSLVFPLLVVLLVSEIAAREWLSDMRIWSIMRIGYKPYISKKICFILACVCLYILLGDFLSLLFLGITHGFQWASDPRIIAPGLNGIFSQFQTTTILICLQMIQAIGYALCSLWILQFAKRIWETIVYPFILIVLLPIILMNLMAIPESWVPSYSNDLLIYEQESGLHSLEINTITWLGFAAIYAFLLFITLSSKRRKGLVR